jgi:hypothetical protein
MVTVQVDPDLLLITQVSLTAKVKSAVLMTGAVLIESPHEGAVLGPFAVST